MTARDIGFITKQIAGHGRRDASAPAEWTALMLAARSVGEDEFCEAVASRTRLVFLTHGLADADSPLYEVRSAWLKVCP